MGRRSEVAVSNLVACSFIQPWLWAILEHHKGVAIRGQFLAVENRSWRPDRLMLGRKIALHASAKWDRGGARFIRRTLATLGLEAKAPPASSAPRGAILGSAMLVAAIRKEGSRGEVVGPIVDGDADLLAASPWSFGPWIWGARQRPQAPRTRALQGRARDLARARGRGRARARARVSPWVTRPPSRGGKTWNPWQGCRKPREGVPWVTVMTSRPFAFARGPTGSGMSWSAQSAVHAPSP